MLKIHRRRTYCWRTKVSAKPEWWNPGRGFKNGRLEQGFLNFNASMTPLRILSKYRVWFHGSGMGPEILHLTISLGCQWGWCQDHTVSRGSRLERLSSSDRFSLDGVLLFRRCLTALTEFRLHQNIPSPLPQFILSTWNKSPRRCSTPKGLQSEINLLNTTNFPSWRPTRCMNFLKALRNPTTKKLANKLKHCTWFNVEFPLQVLQVSLLDRLYQSLRGGIQTSFVFELSPGDSKM